MRGKNSSISSVTQQQELSPGSGVPAAPRGLGAGAPQAPAARAPFPAHREQVQTPRPASSPPYSLGTLRLVRASLWGARKQQLNTQVISLPASAILAVGGGLAAAAFTQPVIHGTSHGSRQVLPDPFVNGSSNSRDLSQPQDRHTRNPGCYPRRLSRRPRRESPVRGSSIIRAAKQQERVSIAPAASVPTGTGSVLPLATLEPCPVRSGPVRSGPAHATPTLTPARLSSARRVSAHRGPAAP